MSQEEVDLFRLVLLIFMWDPPAFPSSCTFKNWFMLSLHLSSYGCMWEVGRAWEKGSERAKRCGCWLLVHCMLSKPHLRVVVCYFGRLIASQNPAGAQLFLSRQSLPTASPAFEMVVILASSTHSLPSFKFPLQPHQKYYITQYEGLGLSSLIQMKDGYTYQFSLHHLYIYL